MLDRIVVREFLEDRFEEARIDLPNDIKMSDLVETFSLYTENDYYDWLKDNFESFFDGFDWQGIRNRIKDYKKEYNL